MTLVTLFCLSFSYGPVNIEISLWKLERSATEELTELYKLFQI